MKRLCDTCRADLGVEYIGRTGLAEDGPCVVCEERSKVVFLLGQLSDVRAVLRAVSFAGTVQAINEVTACEWAKDAQAWAAARAREG